MYVYHVRDCIFFIFLKTWHKGVCLKISTIDNLMFDHTAADVIRLRMLVIDILSFLPKLLTSSRVSFDSV